MKIMLADTDRSNLKNGAAGVTRAGLQMRALISFHYYAKSDLDRIIPEAFPDGTPDLFLDSGGFSAATQGAEIDLQEYAGYIKRFAHHIGTYANLDVIGDPVATLENQKRMEDAGLTPVPVFHIGEDFSYLEQYVEAYPYVALGGMVPHMRYTNRLMPWLIKCFRIAKGRALLHGFGATSWQIIRRLPWFSVDSSSWGMGFRYGRVNMFDEMAGRFVAVAVGDIEGWKPWRALLNRYGFQWEDFAYRERNVRAKLCALSALSYMLAERWLCAGRPPVTIDTTRPEVARFADAQPAFQLYLAEVKHGFADLRSIKQHLST